MPIGGGVFGDEQLAGVDATGGADFELLLTRGHTSRDLEIQVGAAGNGVEIDFFAIGIDQLVVELVRHLDGGLVGFEAKRSDLVAGHDGGAGRSLELDGGSSGLLQAHVLLADQVLVELLDPGSGGLVDAADGAGVLEIVGEVPDGRLGCGDSFLVGQTGHACGLSDHLEVGLRVAALGDPGYLGLNLGVALKVVGAREVFPVADGQVRFEHDADVEFDAVGLDGGVLVPAGVDAEQLGGDAAVVRLHVEAVETLLGGSELRVALRVREARVICVC